MTSTHAHLMDATYRHQRLIYDATRRYYLLGRDHLISDLAPPPGATVLEIACGTGRNLARIARHYPECSLFGLDISQEMLRSARAKLGTGARLEMADACAFDGATLFGQPQFDRIVLSYSLSMIPDWQAALSRAVDHLAPGGQLHIVDFGNQAHLPGWFRSGLRAWLARFHVEPRAALQWSVAAYADQCRVHHRSLYRDYAQYAVLSRPNHR
ncbi:S-adenosylmethionine-diacylgycerolhomoserine-N-methyltransferase [Rhodobacteraceae bacterium MBR-64]